MRTKQPEAAMSHFIESGNTDKAIEAAIAAQQWKKATQILESTHSANSERYYKQIADHYNATKQFEAAAAMMIKARFLDFEKGHIFTGQLASQTLNR